MLAFLHRTSFGYEGPAVQSRCVVLRLHASGAHALGCELRPRHRDHVCRSSRRSSTCCTAASPAAGRRFVASKGARTQLAVLGFIVMLGIAANYVLEPLRTRAQSGRPLRGRELHRRQRDPARAVDPRRHRRARWPDVPAGDLARRLAHSRHGRGPHGAVGHRDRRRLPGDRPELPGGPERPGVRGPVHPARHQRDRYAYGIDNVDATQYKATHRGRMPTPCAPTPTPRRRSACSTPTSCRPTFQQLQQNKQYYSFPSTLTVDRYRINGEIARHRDRGARN